MGTKFAPVYATLVIGYLEEILTENKMQSTVISLQTNLLKTGKYF